MKRLLPLLFCLAMAIPAAHSQAYTRLWESTANKPVTSTNPLPVTTTPSTVVTQATITNTTASIENTSTTITLAAASTHLSIKTDPTAAVIYVDLANGTATTADFRIEPGAALTLDNLPAMTQFKYIGASATGTISICAW